MNNKLFSVCIPTYNRAHFLRNSLESLYRQINDTNRDKVEVLVSNNCSTDNTDALVREYMRRGMEITYFVNRENIGPDGNMVQCIRKSRGKYVLLLGDDDLLLDGALDFLLEVMYRGEYGVIYISGRSYRERNLCAPAFSEEILKKQTYHDVNSFLRKESYYITFISGNVFNKTLLPDFDAERYRNSYLIQVPFFLYAALHAKMNCYLEEKLIAAGGNGDDNGGYKLYTVFGVNLFELLVDFKKDGITDETIHQISNQLLTTFFPAWILAARKKGKFYDESIRVLEKHHGDNWRYKYLCFPLHFLPSLVANLYFLFYRILWKMLRILVCSTS